jgi:hypothetical protein
MSIKELLQIVTKISDCRVYPSTGLPKVPDGYILPSDIKEFYSLCGGIDLYSNTEGFFYKFLPPEKFLFANLVILGEETALEISSSKEYQKDVTLNCFTIISDSNGDFLVIDLNKMRHGFCYDAFHETYCLVGDMPIIAKSFTELLEKLIKNEGKSIFWLDDNFEPLGEAYDNTNN